MAFSSLLADVARVFEAIGATVLVIGLVWSVVAASLTWRADGRRRTDPAQRCRTRAHRPDQNLSQCLAAGGDRRAAALATIRGKGRSGAERDCQPDPSSFQEAPGRGGVMGVAG